MVRPESHRNHCRRQPDPRTINEAGKRPLRKPQALEKWRSRPKTQAGPAHHPENQTRSRASSRLHRRPGIPHRRPAPFRRLNPEQFVRRRNVLAPIPKYSRAPGPGLFYFQRNEFLPRRRHALGLQRDHAKEFPAASPLGNGRNPQHEGISSNRRRTPPRQRSSKRRHVALARIHRRPHVPSGPPTSIFRPLLHPRRNDRQPRSSNPRTSPRSSQRILPTRPNSSRSPRPGKKPQADSGRSSLLMRPR